MNILKILLFSLYIFTSFEGTHIIAQVRNTPNIALHTAKDMGLNGKVKTYKVTPYKIIDNFGVVVKGSKQDFWNGDNILVFDENGYKIESNHYNKKGSISQKVIYKYNNGKRISRDVYNAFGRIEFKFVYVYDNKGYKIAYNSYKPTGELNDTYTYVNDAKGNMIEEVWTKANKTFGSKYSYKYDNKGQLLEVCIYTKSPDILENCTLYKYDKMGRVSEIEKYNKEQKLTERNVFTYDNAGNELSNKYFDSKGFFLSERIYKYTFDKKGNWIQRIEYINHFPKSIIEREITYY